MKTKSIFLLLSLLLLVIISCNRSDNDKSMSGDNLKQRSASARVSSTKPLMVGVFGGGPIYQKRETSIPDLKSSGFTHVVVWTIHIDENGNLNFNGEFPLVKDGVYIGADKYPNFASDIASLKTGTTSVVRVEFGLSAAGSGTFANIKSLVASDGTSSKSILYKNFQALKRAIPAVDAMNFDDESTYDVASSVDFGVMLGNLGYKITLCPYTQSDYWSSVASKTNARKPGTVDLVMLQCYDGGAGNNPCKWNIFGDIPVYGSFWGGSTSDITSKMRSWKTTCGTNGAFMWIYDEMVNTPGKAAGYASAIKAGLK